MKKLILGAVALLFAVQVSFAQSEAEAKAQEKTREWTEKLALTAEQQGAVSSILVDHINAKKAIKDDASLDEATKTTRKAELEANLDARVHEVLSDEQKVQYTQYINEKRQEEANKR